MKEISAGGVVYKGGKDALEIMLIQDRYGKITLPKGKMEPGETVEQTALREILEETGITGRIVQPIEITLYQYRHPEKGEVDKEVHYYLVEAEGGELKAQIEEIRGVEWMPPDMAWEMAIKSGYGNNLPVLKKALRLLGVNEQH